MKKILFFLTLFLLGAGMSYAQNVIFVKSGVTDGETITVGSETGKAYTTLKEAVAHATTGDIVKLTEDVTEEGTVTHPYGAKCCVVHDGITIDGDGYSLTVTGISGGYTCAIYTKGGTIRNLTVTGGFRVIFSGGSTSDINIDHCVIDAGSTGAYTFNSDAAGTYALNITNTTLKGWTSYTTGYTSSTIANNTFDKCSRLGYGYYRPYIPTIIDQCTFTSSVSVDGSNDGAGTGNILFNECTYNGNPITDDNVSSVLDGDYSNHSWVVPTEPMTRNSDGEITGGVYSGDLDYLKTLLADGYEAIPLGTDPETYRVTPVYYIHYNNNGGSGEMDDDYVAQDAPDYTVPASTFTNGDWTFDKWNTKADGTGTDLNVGDVMTLTSDTTLYAQWKGVAKIGDTHYLTLNEAAAAVPTGTPTTITILQNLNFYDITSSNLTNKTITFTGVATDTLSITPDNGNNAYLVTASGADLTFETITLWNPMEPDGKDRGIAHLNRLTINNCEVIGFMRGYASIMFTCNNCTFTKSGKYHLWTYGANCTFNNCVFNSSYDGKAINVYWNANTDPYRVITFNDCAFNSDPVSNGSAIQINSASTCFVVNINNCTTSGYNNPSSCIGSLSGNEAHSHLVNNKTGCATGRTTLYIDGVQILKQSDCDPVAKIGDTHYQTLQAALDDAHEMTGDVTINIISDDINTYSVIREKNGLNLTIEGNNHKLDGQLIINGMGLGISGTGTVTIQNLNFNGDKTNFLSGTDAFVLLPKPATIPSPYNSNTYNYANHVTIDNCKFISTSSDLNVVGIKVTSSAGAYNLALTNCTGNNLHSLAQLTGTTGSTFDHCVVTNSDSYINIDGGAGNHNISNCKFTSSTSDGYGIREKGSSGAIITLVSDTITAASSLVLGKNDAPLGSINVESGVYNGTLAKNMTAAGTAIFSFTGGTFDQDSATVADCCAEGYCAVPNDPSAGLVTVRKMYQVNYDANGGTGTPMVPSYVRPFAGTTFEVKDNEGYVYGASSFTGWNTKADGTGTPFAAGATMAIESDTTLYAQWGYVAMIGTTPYATLQAAVDSANKNMTGDVTIDLVQNTSEVVTVLQKAENNLTINGNGNTLTGQMFISSNQEGDIWNGTDKINITNLKFAYDENYFNLEGSTDYWITDGFIVFCRNCFFTSKLNYAHNVTISDCEFDGAGSTQKIYAVKSGASGGVNKVVLENCTAKNVLGLAELQSTANFTVTGCTATENVDRGLYIAGSKGNHHITNNTITATEYAVHIQYQTTTGTTDSLSGNTFEAPVVFKLDHNESPNVTLDITSGTYKGTINDQDASTIFNIAGGTYSEDVTGEPCAPGYAAFANGTTPETWTVTKAWFLYYDKKEASASGTMDTVFVKQSDPDAGRTVTVANCDFTWLPDHSFLAWNTKANALGDTLRPGDNIILSSDTTLYVIWQEGYTIFYDNNGGVGTIPNQYKAVDETITLSDGTDGAGNYLFTKTDSTLYRWNTAANESGNNYALGAEYSANDNVTMYAVWRLNLDMTMDSTDVVCYGENNGTDTVKIIGGEAPYMLVLSSSVLPQNDTVKDIMDTKYVFENLKPGSYNVELSDVLKKDFITGTFTIAQPDTLIVETMTVPVKPCPLMGTGEYNVSMTTTGGNGDNHFVWSNAAVNVGAMATTVISGADDRDSTYTVTVTVTDKKGCTATRTETFSVSPVIADDGTVHANSKLTTNPDTIKVGIYQGCDTIIRDFGTFVLTSTNSAIDVNILDTVYNDVDVNYPDSTFPVGYSTIIWTAIDTCGHRITGEQVVYIYHFPCPDAVLDGHTYHSVRVGCTCWTNENLRAEKYSDGRPIENVMTYVSDLHPNTTENANIYGHLYDWYAAADTATNSVADIEANYALGKHIQGICPEGWSLPNDEDFAELYSINARDLRSTDLWISNYSGNPGTNASGFNAIPSGWYNCSTGRFENLGTESYYWSCHPIYDMSTGAMIGYVCEKIQDATTIERCSGLSIRCVLIYE